MQRYKRLRPPTSMLEEVFDLIPDLVQIPHKLEHTSILNLGVQGGANQEVKKALKGGAGFRTSTVGPT